METKLLENIAELEARLRTSEKYILAICAINDLKFPHQRTMEIIIKEEREKARTKYGLPS